MTTRTLTVPETDCGFLTWQCDKGEKQLEVVEFLTIGRDSANQLILDDAFVSARHCRIERKPNGFLLRDLRSRNGTYLNGARVFEAMLGDGDLIHVGQMDLHFTWRRLSNDSEFRLKSKNPIWNEQLQKLPNLAQSPYPVLICGPSGTGKDVWAQTIHQM